MNGDGNVESSTQEDTFLPFYCIWIGFGISCFAVIIAWLIWRMLGGGAFELVLGFAVLGVLLCIMVTAIRTTVIIVLEGRSKKSTIEPVPVQLRAISADRWKIVDPFERRGVL